MANFDVAAFIWPSYHYEPRMKDVWTDGDGEWITVRNAQPKSEGHNQPRIPLLGYQDEADPEVMKQHTQLALGHGVNVFIMDWYWYDDAPFLERQLNEGVIPAVEGTDMKFYIMWANHTANSAWDPTTDERNTYWEGGVSRDIFEKIALRWIEKYFGHPNYYKIDGKPVFCLYHLSTFIDGIGSFEDARDAFSWFRERVKEAGFPGLHLQNTFMRHIPKEILDKVPDLEVGPEEAFRRMGFDSMTRYQWVHCSGADERDYSDWGKTGVEDWEKTYGEFGTVFPHVSIGWDNNPRFPSYTKIVKNETPELFEGFLRDAKAFLDSHPDLHPLVTINSWNEWTEGSYLLPDKKFGYGYLQAVKNVFGD